MDKDIARRCCVCKAVQIGDEYVPWSDEMKGKHRYSDTYFSEKCARDYHGEDFEDMFGSEKFELKECPARSSNCD